MSGIRSSLAGPGKQLKREVKSFSQMDWVLITFNSKLFIPKWPILGQPARGPCSHFWNHSQNFWAEAAFKTKTHLGLLIPPLHMWSEQVKKTLKHLSLSVIHISFTRTGLFYLPTSAWQQRLKKSVLNKWMLHEQIFTRHLLCTRDRECMSELDRDHLYQGALTGRWETKYSSGAICAKCCGT